MWSTGRLTTYSTTLGYSVCCLAWSRSSSALLSGRACHPQNSVRKVPSTRDGKQPEGPCRLVVIGQFHRDPDKFLFYVIRPYPSYTIHMV